MTELKTVQIYTDGACSGNPGPGGWGTVLIFSGVEKELSGGEINTTNQRMELSAAINGLRALKFPCRVQLYSDSAYLINAFTQDWLSGWVRNGWKNSKKNPVANQELWEELQELSKIHEIEWIKVKGHADNAYNNRCDELARSAVPQ